MKQITKPQAVAIFRSKAWTRWTVEEIVRFQLYQDRLAMPFGTFHEAVEVVLGRSVWTHEFADTVRLQEEYEGAREAPSFEEILAQVPGKVLLVLVDAEVPDAEG